MSDPKSPDSVPPLGDLTRPDKVAKPSEHPSIHALHPGYYIRDKPFDPTWRHKLYYALRKLIDWIHP